ncbi:NADH dehydrogenase [ubiquinone] 1 alpha subcomplex assembly factor 3 [Hetaerina americana]|uniref:NADH dehydrogenase [ubiquinone] 1 alpha subcomplex assembly factor 3 n=1 Tax=Hetaerina americana TaxID=62018 RepID=UPI003A7F483C
MLAFGSRIANIGRTNILATVYAGRNILPRRRCSEAAEGRTTVNILNTESDAALMVDSYSQMGFRLNNGLAIIGPMVIFPKTVLSWNVGGVEDITVESLSLFFVLEPKIDILVIGLGDRGNKLNMSVIKDLKRHGTNVEMLPTDTACSTFNFLNAERRSVAGAFIPPRLYSVNEDDLVLSQSRKKELFKLGDELEKP